MKSRIRFVYIRSRSLLEAQNYPVLTMLAQSLASIYVSLECFICHIPDVYIDTTGAAFTYPLAKFIMGCKIVAYVHYPIISTDMLQKVREMRPSYNNYEKIASNRSVSTLKLIYYHIFALCYSLVGACTDVVMVNSNWTRRHIEALW